VKRLLGFTVGSAPAQKIQKTVKNENYLLEIIRVSVLIIPEKLNNICKILKEVEIKSATSYPDKHDINFIPQLSHSRHIFDTNLISNIALITHPVTKFI
jgi:hypothetical protein